MKKEWDDPEREQDEAPYDQLADLIDRVWDAMHEWNHSIPHVLPQ